MLSVFPGGCKLVGPQQEEAGAAADGWCLVIYFKEGENVAASLKTNFKATQNVPLLLFLIEMTLKSLKK